jgi:Domain of unknown function (DUF4465)
MMCRLPLFAFAVAILGNVSYAGLVTSTFEDSGVPANSYFNNAGSGQFVSGGSSFNNNYDSTYGAWSGWAISSVTDNTTTGYTNQYSAITGTGAGGSATYAVADTFGPNADAFAPASSFIDLASGTNPLSAEITNTTYTYYSMKNGDMFAKQFGTGDYLLLDIKGWSGLDGTGSSVGDVTFYLANFLNGNHYIVNTWQNVDLTSLAGAKSLQFGLTSTDNDPTYGMNTPAYFALDNLQLTTVSSVPEPGTGFLAVLALVSLPFLFPRTRRLTSCPKAN